MERLQARFPALKRWIGDGEVAKGIGQGLFIGILLLVLVRAGTSWLNPPASAPIVSAPNVSSVPQTQPQAHTRKSARFDGKPAAADVHRLADWIARTGDAAGMEFVIIDKKNARLHVFDADAHLKGSSVILIGAAVGDDTVPGIGLREIADVRPEERTTPAGRFVAQRGHDLKGEDMIWVDYDAGVSMHRVVTSNPKERRLQRLATPALEDKRISYGCINLPVAFYEQYVQPMFAKGRAVVYVLPEIKPLEKVFALAH
jgi:hypothetical protein